MNQLTQALLYCLAGTGFTFFCTPPAPLSYFFLKRRSKLAFSASFWGLPPVS